MTDENKVLDGQVNPAEGQDPAIAFKKEEDPKEKEKNPTENGGCEDNSGKEDSGKTEDKTEGSEKEKDDEKEKKGKREYSLNEIPEYVDLLTKHQALQTSYAALEQEKNALMEEIKPLRTFKLEHEREDKEKMINSFYMLSDEDKKDVLDNIDSYSLNEIESNLAVLCFRKGLGFAPAGDEEHTEDATLTYNLNSAAEQTSNIPAWLKAVQQTEQEMK